MLVKGFSATDIVSSDDNWIIHKNSPFLSYSAEFGFNFKNNKLNEGKVIRTGFMCPRYYYDLYDKENNFQLRAITRFLSIGFFQPRFMDIDIYEGNNLIAQVQGKILARPRAKFYFYDAFGKKTAVAYLNAKSADFLIVSSEDESIIAHLKGPTFDEVGPLQMKFDTKDFSVDERVLKIFAAFIFDYNEHFIPKPEEKIEDPYSPARREDPYSQARILIEKSKSSPYFNDFEKIENLINKIIDPLDQNKLTNELIEIYIQNNKIVKAKAFINKMIQSTPKRIHEDGSIFYHWRIDAAQLEVFNYYIRSNEVDKAKDYLSEFVNPLYKEKALEKLDKMSIELESVLNKFGKGK